MRQSVALSNINISEANGPIAIKLCLKQHCGAGKATLGLGPDRNRTLVSHRLIIREMWPL